jgi:hypothetical protein
MSEGNKGKDLLEKVAEEQGVPLRLLRDLAALEDNFPDINARGAKTELGRRVGELLDAAVAEEASR